MDNKDLFKQAKEQLLEAMYQDAENLFPDMEIKLWKGKKVSPYHLDKSLHDKGKVTYFNPGGYRYTVFDFSVQGHNPTILDYYLEKNNKKDSFATVFPELCRKYQIELPEKTLTPEEINKYKEAQRLREWAQDIFVRELWSGSPEAQKALDYMKGRGWTEEQIKRAGVGLFAPSLKGRIIKEDDIKTLGLNSSAPATDGSSLYIGTDYTLSIPHRSGSSLEGWNFRILEGSRTSTKYLHSSGVGAKGTLQGLRRNDKNLPLIIVEGDLDALHPQTMGALNVAATMGGEVRSTQVDDAKGKGYRQFILLFDNDPRGQGFINKSIENIERGGCKVYVSSLPQGVKDTDEYLSTHTVQEWVDEVKRQSSPVCLRRLWEIMLPYSGRTLDQVDKDQIIEQFKTLVRKTPIEDRELLKRNLLYYSDCLGVSKKDLEEAFLISLSTLDEKSRAQAIEEAVLKINELLSQSKTEEAFRTMKGTADKISQNTGSIKFSKDFAPYNSLEDLRQDLSTIEEGLPTGIEFRGEKTKNHFTIKEGISLVCGAQGHRKTTFLLNIALNEAERNLKTWQIDKTKPLKKVLFYTYEMDRRRIFQSLINMGIDGDLGNNNLEIIETVLKGKDRTFRRKDQVTGREESLSLSSEIDKFLRRYIISGAIQVIYSDYKAGTLIDSMKFYRATNEVSLVLLDYAQQVYSENYTRQRTEEIKDVVNRIKDYAVSTSLRVLMGAQFNRQIETPLDLKTQNIGEGGDFERIGVDIIGLYNLRKLDLPGLYVAKTAGAKTEEQGIVLGADGVKIRNLYGIKTGQFSETIASNIEKAKTEGAFLKDMLYLRLLKSRYGDYPLDLVLGINDKSGRIYLNEESKLKVEEKAQEQTLWEIPDSVTGGTHRHEIEDEGEEPNLLPF